jgi:hypothetical protein
LHICWEDIVKSKWILEILLNGICKEKRFIVYQSILLRLLQLKDSFQSTRIIIALSPFNKKDAGEGILAQIHKIHFQNRKLAFQLIAFLIQIINLCPESVYYLSKVRKEIVWIEQFLEENLNPKGIEEAGQYEADEGENGDDSMDSDREMILPGLQAEKFKPELKYESVKLVYTIIKKFLASFGDNEPNFEHERELVEKVEKLKQENLRLKEALEYYRSKASNVKPPAFMMNPRWDEEKIQFNKAKYEDDDDTENDEPTATLEDRHIMDTEMTSNIDAEKKAKQLVEVFGHISMNVALTALKRVDYDVEQAAGLLSDDMHLGNIIKEAEMTDYNKDNSSINGKRLLSQ